MAQRPDRARPGEGGVALLVVVSLIALLTAIGIGIQSEVTRSLTHAQYARATDTAKRMAELGLGAASMLITYDWEEDKRAGELVDYHFTIDMDEGIQALASLGEVDEIWSMFRPGQASPLSMMGMGSLIPIGEGAVEIQIAEQNSRYNVQRLLWGEGRLKPDHPEYLGFENGVWVTLGDRQQAREVAASIVDWIDTDDERFTAQGAESFYYQSLDPPYAARNGPIQHIEELRAIKGVDEKAYRNLVSAVTVWPNHLGLYSEYKLNINTATPEALTFIHPDIGWQTAQEIVASRDKEPFLTTSEWQDYFQQDLQLKMGEIINRDLVTVSSDTWLVTITGYAEVPGLGEGGGSLAWAMLEAVLYRDSQSGVVRVKHRRWRTFQGEQGGAL